MRKQIERCLLAYTRGIDRLDAELIATAFHPGAILEGYGRAGESTVEAFIDRAIPSLRDAYAATQHRISNTCIDRRDDHVRVETYVLAFHLQVVDDGPDRLLTFNGRYIDRFTQQDGDLRIAQRSLRHDWSKIEDVAATMPGEWVHSARDRTDAIY